MNSVFTKSIIRFFVPIIFRLKIAINFSFHFLSTSHLFENKLKEFLADRFHNFHQLLFLRFLTIEFLENCLRFALNYYRAPQVFHFL